MSAERERIVVFTPDVGVASLVGSAAGVGVGTVLVIYHKHPYDQAASQVATKETELNAIAEVYREAISEQPSTPDGVIKFLDRSYAAKNSQYMAAVNDQPERPSMTTEAALLFSPAVIGALVFTVAAISVRYGRHIYRRQRGQRQEQLAAKLALEQAICEFAEQLDAFDARNLQ